MKFNIASRTVLISVLCLCLIGCTPAQIIADITTAVNAAEVIIPIIMPFLNASPKAQAVSDWTQAALAGLDSVSNCLSIGGTQTEQAACVTANLAKVAATVPELAGLPSNVAAAVSVLASDVENLLKTYGTPPTAKAASSTTEIHYNARAQSQLSALKVRIAKDLGRLRAGR